MAQLTESNLNESRERISEWQKEMDIDISKFLEKGNKAAAKRARDYALWIGKESKNLRKLITQINKERASTPVKKIRAGNPESVNLPQYDICIKQGLVGYCISSTLCRVEFGGNISTTYLKA